jgi:hypothetical protein
VGGRPGGGPGIAAATKAAPKGGEELEPHLRGTFGKLGKKKIITKTKLPKREEQKREQKSKKGSKKGSKRHGINLNSEGVIKLTEEGQIMGISFQTVSGRRGSGGGG